VVITLRPNRVSEASNSAEKIASWSWMMKRYQLSPARMSQPTLSQSMDISVKSLRTMWISSQREMFLRRTTHSLSGNPLWPLAANPVRGSGTRLDVRRTTSVVKNSFDFRWNARKLDFAGFRGSSPNVQSVWPRIYPSNIHRLYGSRSKWGASNALTTEQGVSSEINLLAISRLLGF
jgi:hypothetical protein